MRKLSACQGLPPEPFSRIGHPLRRTNQLEARLETRPGQLTREMRSKTNVEEN